MYDAANAVDKFANHTLITTNDKSAIYGQSLIFIVKTRSENKVG